MGDDDNTSIWAWDDLLNMSSYNSTPDIETTTTAQTSGASMSDIYFIVGMLSVFSVVGTIGNALIIYVFSNMLKQKLTSTVFILTLGGTDLITCCITIPGTVLFEYYDYNVQYDIPCKIYMFLMTTTVPFSSFIMVAIGIDRYLCICHPFLHAMNIKRAKMMVAGMAAWIFPFGIIIALFYGVYSDVDAANINCLVEHNITSTNTTSDVFDNVGWILINGSSYFQNETGLYLNTSCFKEKHYEFTGMCDSYFYIFPEKMLYPLKLIHSSFFVVAISIVFVLYGLILKRVIAQNKSRGTSNPFKGCCTRSLKNDTKLAPINGEATNDVIKDGDTSQSVRLKGNTRRRGSNKKGDKMLIANLKIAGTLFTVTLVFCLSFLPSYLMALKIIPMNIRMFNCYFVYNIANPVIYAFLNPSFREQLKQLFPCLKKKPKTRSAGPESRTTTLL